MITPLVTPLVSLHLYQPLDQYFIICLIYKNNKYTETNQVRNFPLVCDFNPSLPPIASFIHKYKYLFELDDNLKKVINPRKMYNLNCKSKNIIYKLDDLICKRTSVDSSITGMSTCWTNHKSHIRKYVKSCEIANHFSSTSCHVLDKKSKINIFNDPNTCYY